MSQCKYLLREKGLPVNFKQFVAFKFLVADVCNDRMTIFIANTVCFAK